MTAQNSTKPVAVLWGQDNKHIFLNLQSDEIAKNKNQYTITINDNLVQFQCGSSKLNLNLSSTIDSASSTHKISGTRVTVQLVKKPLQIWKVLTKNKMANVAIDWNRWLVEETEEVAMQNISTLNHPMMAHEKNDKILLNAPSLQPNNEKWKKYYLSELTCAQRMLTLVHMWNCSALEERQSFVGRLVDIIKDETISKLIKGSGELLRELDVGFYINVTHETTWVKSFKLFNEKQKVDCLEAIYKILPPAEQQLVLQTLT